MSVLGVLALLLAACGASSSTDASVSDAPPESSASVATSESSTTVGPDTPAIALGDATAGGSQSTPTSTGTAAPSLPRPPLAPLAYSTDVRRAP